jgi:hypothetical protein
MAKASYRTNLVTTLLGTWFTVGLFLDAWAHNNVPELETFFTPWHAVFYSGFVATAAWIAWTVKDAVRGGWRGVSAFRAMPAGYGAAAVALVSFGVFAVGDMTWHGVFGVEQDINILFSPTHLGLITSMIVIVTTPMRAAWADRDLPAAPGLRPLLPAVLSLALATTQVLLLLQYVNALVYSSGSVVIALSAGDQGWTAGFVSALAVTTLVIGAPLLTVARRWLPPFGTATILYALLGGLSGAITGFRDVPMLIAFVAAGVGVDLLVRGLRPAPSRLWRYRLFAALSPLLTWTVYIVTAYYTSPPIAPRFGSVEHPEGVVELWTGVPVVQAALGLLLAVLLVPVHRPDPPPRGQVEEPREASDFEPAVQHQA